jgi:hypothetical protein
MQNLFATNSIQCGEHALMTTTKDNQWGQFVTGKQAGKE